MFDQLYADIDKLHQAVKPFYRSVALSRLDKVGFFWKSYAKSVEDLSREILSTATAVQALENVLKDQHTK